MAIEKALQSPLGGIETSPTGACSVRTPNVSVTTNDWVSTTWDSARFRGAGSRRTHTFLIGVLEPEASAGTCIATGEPSRRWALAQRLFGDHVALATALGR